MKSRTLLILGIGCCALSLSLHAQGSSNEEDSEESIAEVTLRPSVRGHLALDIQVWHIAGLHLDAIRHAALPCEWVPEDGHTRFLSGTCRHYFASDGTSASGRLDLAPLVILLHASGVGSVRVILDDFRKEIAQAPAGWTVENAQQRAKKFGEKRSVSQAEGPTYWFISDDDELPPPFHLRMGTPWSAAPVAIPFAFTLCGPALLALWLRRRAERTGTLQAAAVWVHWILNATWLYWIFSASASRIGELLAHLRIEAFAATFLLGSILMAAPPLFAIAACSAILLRDPDGERETSSLVKRAVARESVLMVPLAIFLGSASGINEDWRLGALAVPVAYVVYRLLAAYVGRWITHGLEILTHGELMDAASAIASKAGVKLTAVYVLGNRDTREVNAFAGGAGVMAMTRGLIERLTRRELIAVMSHEVGHLRGRHVAMSSLAFWAYIILSGPLTGALIKYAHAPVWVFTLPLMPVGYILAVTFLSRKNEFNADARAVDLTGDPEATIAALARLRMLTRTPVAWGGIQGSILSHPSMRDRVLAIARHAGIAEERALALLDDPDLLYAGVETASRHFPLPPECAGTEMLFSSNAKASYFLWVGWAEQLALVALCAGVSLFADLVWPRFPFSGLLVFASIPPLAWAYLIFSNWLGRCFKRSIHERLRRQMGALADGGTFVGLLPGPLPVTVEGFYQSEVGFIWLAPEAVVYRGERTAFALPRNAIHSVAIVNGPLSWDRAHLVRIDCEGGSLLLSRPDIGTTTRHARRLKRRLDDWLAGTLSEPSPGAEPPPPASVLRPVATDCLRGWRALRLIGKRAGMLFIGLLLLESLIVRIPVPVLHVLPLVVLFAYLFANLPYLLRRKPKGSAVTVSRLESAAGETPREFEFEPSLQRAVTTPTSESAQP